MLSQQVSVRLPLPFRLQRMRQCRSMIFFILVRRWVRKNDWTFLDMTHGDTKDLNGTVASIAGVSAAVAAAVRRRVPVLSCAALQRSPPQTRLRRNRTHHRQLARRNSFLPISTTFFYSFASIFFLWISRHFAHDTCCHLFNFIRRHFCDIFAKF